MTCLKRVVTSSCMTRPTDWSKCPHSNRKHQWTKPKLKFVISGRNEPKDISPSKNRPLSIDCDNTFPSERNFWRLCTLELVARLLGVFALVRNFVFHASHSVSSQVKLSCTSDTPETKKRMSESGFTRGRHENSVLVSHSVSRFTRGWIFLLFLCVFQPVTCDHHSAPHFVVQPSFSGGVVTEGQSKILQCQAVGFPPPDYKWLKDGLPLGDFTNDPLLRMAHITTDSAGNYQCIARNSAGAIFSQKTALTVAFIIPPSEVHNASVSVQAGAAAVLEPPFVDSVPIPTAHWQKVGMGHLYGRRYVTTKDNKLVILSAEVDDSGQYQVVFTNAQVGQEVTGGFTNLTVTAGYLPEESNPSIVVKPRDSLFEQGSMSVFECIANASPLEDLKIIWWKDGVEIAAAGLSHFLSPWNQSLTLLHVVPNHGGLYRCEASRRVSTKSPVIAEANVTIRVKPIITNPPGPETVSELGNNVLLPCGVTGDPSPTVNWYRNAAVVGHEPDGRYSTLANGSLLIGDLTSADAGIFQCMAENAVGEATVSTWLHVKTSPPVFLQAPENITVLDGRDGQIPCETSGAPKPNVAWFLNETLPIYSSGRNQILENGMLLIASVEPKDVGNYTCFRSNSAGTISGSAFLIVLVRTQIVQPPAATRVILSSTAELQCKVSHDPSVPYSVSWLYNDKPVGNTSGGRIHVLPDGTLQIGQARNTDVGIYTCKVVSPGGNDSRSAKLDVIELPHPPNNVQAVIINTIPKSINVSWTKAFDGNSPITAYVVQMRVVPTSAGGGTVDPIIPWQMARSNISGDHKYTILKGLKPSSSYQFRVIAVNGVGEGNPSLPTDTIVLPSEPPGGPPQGILGAARSSTSIMLQWQPPDEEDRNGEILGYAIRYKLAGYAGSPWAYQNVTNAAQHSFLLQDLIVWQNYLIQVAAYNRKGVGVYSEDIFIRTKEGVPQSAPTDVRAEAVNSTAIAVKWKPPDPQLINGINQGYRVEAWHGVPADKNSLAQSVLVPPSPIDPLAELSVVVSSLEKYTWYNVTVLCLTAPGDGPRSIPVRVITNQDTPQQVGPLKFKEILDTSVIVTWSPPAKANGILLGYTLKYHIKNNAESSVVKNLSADTTSVFVDALRPITAYTFQIYGWTVVGNGPARTATIQSGIPPVLPEPPTKLAVSNIGPFSVVLQFTPGFDGNSSIIKWTVLAHTRRNETWFLAYEVTDPEATTVEVHNLVPFTEYRLRLLATNVVGASHASEPTKYFQTIQAPPSHAPYNVTVRAVNAKSLRVRWTPLQQAEWFGIPRGYNISFRAREEEQVYQADILDDHNANSFVLRDLEEFTEYEVFVQAFNDVGISPASSVAVERTRESVPFVGPAQVEANATSSTTIVVRWGEVPKTHQNGIIEGYKVYYGAKTVPFSFRIIEGNTTFTSTLTELKKYTMYSIQVLAYTRIGDGALSLPPVSVRTHEDVPDVPSNISFPDVSTTTARIIWDVPAEPNGEILAYRVSYGQEGLKGEGSVTKELSETERTLKAFNLKPETNYVFSVTAQTNEGWGKTASALVFTTNKRESPQPPSAPHISQSQIQPRQITFSWTPGRDGFAPLRYYTVQIARGDGPWKSLPTKVDPTVATFTVTELQPFTWYKFRIQATNDIGASGWSLSSNLTRTLPAAPAEAPQQITVTPHTTTSVTVTWQPLTANEWNGDMQNPGYRAGYCTVSAYTVPQSGDCPSLRVPGANSSSLSLEHLEKDRIYEIKVFAYNGQGDGPASAPVSVYVGEAVPTGEPRNVRVEALSSTEVKVYWKPPLATQQNGDLLGYKIFYQSELKGTNEEMEAVPVTTTTYVLMDLLKFRDYRIQILAFNPAGDGPRSQPLFVRTMEDLPGLPGKVHFTDVTMTSLNVSWTQPQNPNGRIRGYLIAYETALPDNDFSKQVKQKVAHTYLSVHGLRPLVAYTFTVRAETVGLGPEAVGNVTTGPQEGSPGMPQELQLRQTQTSVTLNWRNGPSGASPIKGYLIEAQLSEESDSEWITLVQLSSGPQVTYTVSFQNLLPSKNYLFRLFTRNDYGISYPAEIQQPFATPSKLYQEYKQKLPFYHEIWFLVTLAASGVIVVIVIIAVLCVKSKSYKYKQEAQKSIQDDHMSMDDGGFATFELRQSKRGTLCKNSLSRKGNAMLAKSPPRPSPACVTYSDEEDVKGYDDGCDSSSLTEKPSEISSTDSQATDSDRESDVKSEPHSFVNHYANVNDTFRQSWKRQRPVKPPSYTDSEPEGSVAVSLNGGHIIMNNMAGSRAPLPGFSSFV